MTFTNSAYQNTIYKCNRILTKSLAGYKEKCLISSLEVPLRKTLKDKFLEPETFIIKSSRDDLKETFLYILGPLTDSDDVYYGRVTLFLSRSTSICSFFPESLKIYSPFPPKPAFPIKKVKQSKTGTTFCIAKSSKGF